MKVLWFTNTASLAESYLNKSLVSGGWIKSLEKMIQQKVDLCISFYHNKRINDFKYGDTSYYPINKYPKGDFNKLKRKLLGSAALEDDICQYLSVVEKVKPDIIHIHGTEMPFGLVQKHTKIPVVYSIQGNINVYTYKYFDGIPKSYLRKIVISNKAFSINSYLVNYFRFKKMANIEYKILQEAKYIIGRTQWDYRITRILAPKSIYFLGNEILRNAFYQNHWSQPWLETIKLFTTNGQSLYKGIETVIKTSFLLESINFNHKWHVAGIGLKDSLVKTACKRLNIDLPKSLVFLGIINEEKLVEEIQISHLYVMPSHIENSPNNLCEAQILGIPVISTFAGGVGSLINDNVSGTLVQNGDPYVLAGTIIDVMNNYEKAIKMARVARKNALVRHNSETIASELLYVYNAIINDK